MGFSLDQHEGIATGIRRIFDEELAKTIDSLEGRGPADRDAAVHDARKRLKKARAAVRLARADLGRDVQRTETAALGDAARRLSGVRDAHVLLETLAALDEHATALPTTAVGDLRTALERRRDELHAAALENGDVVGEVTAQIAAVRERAQEWPLHDESFGSVAKSLQRIYRRGSAAMDAAFEEGDDESWHEWRKRVKDLWYALRILEPVAALQLKGMVAEADRLSDVLGDHNDIAVLRAALEEHAGALDTGQLELVRAAIDRRRDELRLAAVPLGRRLYAEAPKRFVRRTRSYWKARSEQEAAEAIWLEPVLAGRLRELLAARASADAAGKRRIAAQLRGLGVRITDLAERVPRRPGGFAAEDFDTLVAEGVIRIGAVPAPGDRPAPPPVPAPQEPQEAAQAAPGGDGLWPPSPVALVRGSAGLALGAARRMRGKLGL
ncbi:MAG: CHAD domain-containing protein [Solirubrobacterales bacterium]|nr:CHAD domain-containing protein [Solirubrobacterales bacterium]